MPAARSRRVALKPANVIQVSRLELLALNIGQIERVQRYVERFHLCLTTVWHGCDAICAQQGAQGRSRGRSHTSFARIVAEILFGLGKIQRPDVVEVTRRTSSSATFSQTANAAKEPLNRSVRR
jgi:hypothetical protein